MKLFQTTTKLLCVLAAISSSFGAAPAAAQGTLLITEYVEGGGVWRDAVEITNVGASPESLDGWTLAVFHNGAGDNWLPWWYFAWGEAEDGGVFPLDSGTTLLPGETWVVMSSQATPDVAGYADQQFQYFAFDGNDAIVLAYNAVPFDHIGVVGENPGEGWGTETATTKDITLRRHPDAYTPDDDVYAVFDPSMWVEYPTDTYAGLGMSDEEGEELLGGGAGEAAGGVETIPVLPAGSTALVGVLFVVAASGVFCARARAPQRI